MIRTPQATEFKSAEPKLNTDQLWTEVRHGRHIRFVQPQYRLSISSGSGWRLVHSSSVCVSNLPSHDWGWEQVLHWWSVLNTMLLWWLRWIASWVSPFAVSLTSISQCFIHLTFQFFSCWPSHLWVSPLSPSQTASVCSLLPSAEFNTSTCSPRDFSLTL